MSGNRPSEPDPAEASPEPGDDERGGEDDPSRSDPAHRDPAHRFAASGAGTALVFFCSAAVLVIEILAGRLVAPYVGISLETYTAIIGSVLAGIAIGAGVGGWLADKRDPGRLLGPTIVLGGGLALVSLPVVGFIGPGFVGASFGAMDIVSLAVLAFVAPTAVLSAVSPMVAKLRLASTAETGVVVGGLSAAATAGALLGTFLTGFVLVAALPTRPIVVGLGIALIVVGAVLWMALTKTSPLLAISASLIATAVAFVAPQPCEHETAYYCVTVTADPQRSSGRVLTLDNLRHSYVDLEDPLFLEFRYTRLLAGVVDATYGNRSLDALHIGGGGFTLPRWLAARHPGSSSTVLELDPSLVEIDRSELGLQLGRDLRVRTGDARMSIAGEPAGRYDAVIGDAFGGLAVPWHLTTIEMIREIKRTMRPGAVYALNMIDGGPRNLVRAELATLASVFNHVAVVVPPDGGLVGNYVLVASDAPISVGAVPAADGTPIVDDAGVAAFIADAQPLRDDFAPVDQLITRR